MEFQQVMTLLVAAASSGIGASISYGIMKEKVNNITKVVDKLAETVVFKDSCGQCQSKWSAHNINLKDDVVEINNKLDRILIHLSGIAKV